MIRSFIAVKISQENRDKLRNITQVLQEIEPSRDIRWVDPKKIHLTIKFLGDVEPERINQITRSLDNIGAEVYPFRLSIKGMGCFPNPAKASVLWVGLDIKKGDELSALQTSVEKGMQELGFKPESRSFRPHLTLARIKKPLGSNRIQTMLERFQTFQTEDIVTELVLMRSELFPSGSIYTTLHQSAFRGSNS
jgi:2'-5' RNA ligase